MATREKIIAENAGRRQSLKILLSGDFQKEINYVFEIYRQAVLNNINGYIKKQASDRIEICASGQDNAMDHFIKWLKTLIGKSLNINIIMKDDQTDFHEFRIMSSNK